HEAENRQLSFNISVDENLSRSMVTDSKRLQQVLKNLLSNAFKFTAEGGVRMSVSAALGGWSAEHPILNHAPAVVAFEVTDTGIGIPPEIWRHRSWSCHQPRIGKPARRRDSSAQRPGQGQHLRALSAAEIFRTDR